MILYFSGTGNSLYVARKIAAYTGDELVSLNLMIKNKDNTPVSAQRLIFVTPTYAWRIPRIVENRIKETPLREGSEAWFIMTCGSETGNAEKYNRALAKSKGLKYMGTAGIVMPENYIAMFGAPEKDEANKIIAAAASDIELVSSRIGNNEAFDKCRSSLYDRIMSGPVNPVFYRFCVKAGPFTVAENCIGCGKCAKLCPLENISLSSGKPVWGNNCTHCMACICHCPVEAIEYGKKSAGKPRYHID